MEDITQEIADDLAKADGKGSSSGSSYLDKYWANAKDKDNRLWDEERRSSAASSAEYSKQEEEAKKAHDDAIERQVNELLGKNDFSGARNAANNLFDSSRKQNILAAIDEAEKTWKREQIEGVSRDITKAVDDANRATDTAAYNTATDDLNRYSSVSPAESAQMSSNDDAYIANAFTDANLLNNRKTAFMNAVTAGAEKLKAIGEQDVANNLVEAGRLQSDAKTLSAISSGIDSTISMLAGLLKK